MSNINDEGTYCSIKPFKGSAAVLKVFFLNPDTDNDTAVVKKAVGN